jgi:putative hydrolase of the HAD superfamily
LPIRGVIFDFGGVINDMRWDVMFALEEEHGLERGTIVRCTYGHDEWREVEVGRGDMEALDAVRHARLKEAAGRDVPPLHIQWRETWGLINENVELVRALRPPYRVSVLSNADLTLEERMRDGMNIHHLFDDVVCSAVVGMAKPDHAIYRLAAERLSLSVEECVFIDDARRNVEAAQLVGMTAIHYRIDRGDNLTELLAGAGVTPANSD